MTILGYMSYLVGSLPSSLLINSAPLNSFTGLFIPSHLITLLGLYFKYSFFCLNSWLVELGSYEVSGWGGQIQASIKPLLWYMFKLGSGLATLWCFTTLVSNHIPSIELLFRNARWLEKEVGELLGVFFTNKRDRRVIFTLPLFYQAPLRKYFPMGGFYELVLCPISLKLIFANIGWRV